MKPRHAILHGVFFMALLTSSAFGLECYKCEGPGKSCAVKEKLNGTETCESNNGCYKVIVDLGSGNHNYYRSCLNAAKLDPFCNVTAVNQFGNLGANGYCGVCEGDLCNGSSSLTPFILLITLLPCLLTYIFSK